MIDFTKAPPSEKRILEADIEKLDKLLEDNIYNE